MKFFLNILRKPFNRGIKQIDNYRVSQIYESEKEFETIVIEYRKLFGEIPNKRIILFFYIFNYLNSIIQNQVDGDIIECGCGNGQNLLFSIIYLKSKNINKKVYFNDTFKGHIFEPSKKDFKYGSKIKNMTNKYKENLKNNGEVSSWDPSNLGQLKENIKKIDYANAILLDKKSQDYDFSFIEKLSYLRLDSNMYDATSYQLKNLIDKVTKGGIVELDDYYSWNGQNMAVKEFVDFKKFYYLPQQIPRLVLIKK